MRIDDRNERAVEAKADRFNDPYPKPNLFTYSLKNKYIRIYGHSDAEDQTGDTWQRQRRLYQNQHCHCQNHVQHECYNRIDTCAAIVKKHEYNDQSQTAQRGLNTRANRIRSQTRPNRAFFLIVYLRRQGSRLKRQRKIFRVGLCEFSLDRSGVENLSPYHRSRLHLVIQNDSKIFTYAPPGPFAKFLTTGRT